MSRVELDRLDATLMSARILPESETREIAVREAEALYAAGWRAASWPTRIGHMVRAVWAERGGDPR